MSNPKLGVSNVKDFVKKYTSLPPSLPACLPALLPVSYGKEVGYGVRSDSAAASARQATSHPIPSPIFAFSHSVHSKAPSHLAHRQHNTAPHPSAATKFGKSLSRHSSRQPPHPTNTHRIVFTYKQTFFHPYPTRFKCALVERLLSRNHRM
jgi:hypothetical protein